MVTERLRPLVSGEAVGIMPAFDESDVGTLPDTTTPTVECVVAPLAVEADLYRLAALITRALDDSDPASDY